MSGRLRNDDLRNLRLDIGCQVHLLAGLLLAPLV
jgi:hypothetical protein